jgi:hypothetical protein
VSCNSSWGVDVSTASWGHIEKNGNTLTLRVDPNQSNSTRTDYFILKSGSKSLRVDISQAGGTPKSNSTQSGRSKFEISPTKFSVGANGGSTTFTVTCDNSWEIDINTAAWGHLTKNGNTLTLRVDPNSNTSARTDYFRIKSGNQLIRVEISQASGTSTSGSSNQEQSKFEISRKSAVFNSSGGTAIFTVTSANSWQISMNTADWGHLTRNGNMLTLQVDANKHPIERTDFFVIKSGDKLIRVDIAQQAAAEILSINGSTSDISVSYNSDGGVRYISVNTNLTGYQILCLPSWCYIKGKTATGFILGCNSNSNSNPRRDWISIQAGQKDRRINIFQQANYSALCRGQNGGWVNMPIGFEGGYNVGGRDLWYANMLVGVRIGNYTDIVQGEVGVAPGVIASYVDYYKFHLPLYASLKLSIRSGKLYLKLGAAYNLVRDKYYEGNYSLRAGFGSAWKHFDWDWAYVQLNAPVKEWDYNTNIFNTDNMFVGMRWTWYITR